MDVLLTDLTLSIEQLPRDLAKNVDHYHIGKLHAITLLQSLSTSAYQRRRCIDIKSKYKDTSYLSNLDSKEFLCERHQLLLAFSSGSVNIEFRGQTTRSFLYAIAVTAEMIDFLR